MGGLENRRQLREKLQTRRVKKVVVSLRWSWRETKNKTPPGYRRVGWMDDGPPRSLHIGNKLDFELRCGGDLYRDALWLPLREL